MKAYLDGNGVLHIEAEGVYESLALKAWVKENEITNVNGVNMMPSRHFIAQLDTALLPQQNSAQQEKP